VILSLLESEWATIKGDLERYLWTGWPPPAKFETEMACLRQIGVQQLDTLDATDEFPPTIHLMPGNGYTATTSEAALSQLATLLNAKPDNFAKLKASRAEVTHLFVWVDLLTDGSMAHPLSREPGRLDTQFRLPSGAPILDFMPDNVWFVHADFGFGWRWVRDAGWQHVDARLELSTS
jgi:hypothetical protein